MIAAMTWQEAFREHIATHLPTEGLLALRDALRDDSAELIQGCTVVPVPNANLRDARDPCGACAVGYALWKAYRLSTVSVVDYQFNQTVFRAVTMYGEEAMSAFTEWYDFAHRDEMRRELLPEVEAVLASRDQAAGQPCWESLVPPNTATSAGPRPLPPLPKLTFGDVEQGRCRD